PKTLDKADRKPPDNRAAVVEDDRPGADSISTGAVAGAGAAPEPGTKAPAPAKPSVATATKPSAIPPKAAAPPPPAPAEERLEKEKKESPELAWAKEQHSKVVAQAKAGNCQTAATLAVQISNRAPAYYAANVQTDRTLKQCMA